MRRNASRRGGARKYVLASCLERCRVLSGWARSEMLLVELGDWEWNLAYLIDLISPWDEGGCGFTVGGRVM